MTADKKILYANSFAFIIVLLSAFLLPGEYSGRITAAFLLTPLAILFAIFVKKRSIPSMNKREVTFIVGVAAAMYIAIYFLSGILFGLHNSSGSRFWLIFFSCFIPCAVIIVASEVIRSIVRAQGNKLADLLCYAGCIIADVLMVGNLQSITSHSSFVNIVALSFFPAVTANLVFHYLSKRYGVYPNVVYRAITTLYSYVIPYRPLVSDALIAFARLLIPIALFLFIDALYEKKRRYALAKKHRFSKLITALALAAVMTVTALISNQFLYGTLVIATDSMTGEINRSDAVIFERYTDQPIIEGQVIVFDKNDIMVVHRVVDIEIINGQTRYYTKGDANEDLDYGHITDADVVGLVRSRIPYIGAPTLWLRSLFDK